MTSRLTIAAATAALFAGPALAQSETTGDEAAKAMQNQQSQQGSAQSGQQGGEDGSGIMTFNRDRSDVMTGDGQLSEQDRQMMAASQQQVREQLEDSGFEQVAVRRAAYLVTAMSPEGEPVMMLVDTSRMGGRQGQMPGQQGQSMQNQNDTMQNQQNQSDTQANQ